MIAKYLLTVRLARPIIPWIILRIIGRASWNFTFIWISCCWCCRTDTSWAASADILQTTSCGLKPFCWFFSWQLMPAGGWSGLVALNTLYFLQLFNRRAITCASQFTLLHFHIFGRAYPNIFMKVANNDNYFCQPCTLLNQIWNPPENKSKYFSCFLAQCANKSSYNHDLKESNSNFNKNYLNVMLIQPFCHPSARPYS